MSALLKVTESGEEHGLIKKVANSVPFDDFKHMKPDIKTACEKQKAHDHKMIKARYHNHRGQHERLTKPYCRWSGDPIETWHFIPGQVYEVPQGLVEEVNKSPGLAVRSEVVDVNGQPTKKDGANEKIHEFFPAGF